MGEVVSRDELIRLQQEWKQQGRKVVCAAGCFDLLHPGHIRLLEQARQLGDILVVAVESDQSARARPAPGGPVRPIVTASERAEILAALAAVDYVAEFDTLSPSAWPSQLLPDVFVTGGLAGDVAARREDKALEAKGCRVARLALEPGYSTALLMERIQQLRA